MNRTIFSEIVNTRNKEKELLKSKKKRLLQKYKNKNQKTFNKNEFENKTQNLIKKMLENASQKTK
jgi:hypothetical protein